MPASAIGEAEPPGLLAGAREIRRLSIEQWGDRKVTTVIGRHVSMSRALDQVARLALADGPTILTGETGTGKELFARALYLLGRRRGRPFICVNCAQYRDGQLMASELFGHGRGSFTGATADHRGVFETADGGTVFLDEVGELTLGAQAMLLRVLGEGEIVPVGTTTARLVDVRVIAATSRDLPAMVAAGEFRSDLYFRLNAMRVHLPPVRERGEDCQLLATDHLRRLGARAGRNKQLATDAIVLMAAYSWPGNVRELHAVVDVGFSLTDSDTIGASCFAHELESLTRAAQLERVPIIAGSDGTLARMLDEGESFWDVVQRPYLSRDISRAEAMAIVAQGLLQAGGSYRRLLALFNCDDGQYVKFMDFLRHQQLKPRKRAAS